MPTILIAEDHTDLLEEMGAEFKKAGYTVILCDSAAKVLAYLRDNALDGLVTDWEMPERPGVPALTGLDLCRIMKESSATIKAPVVFYTGRADPEDERRAMKAGAALYVLKPRRIAVLVKLVSSLPQIPMPIPPENVES